MSIEQNKKKLLIGGAIIAVCLGGLAYILLRGDGPPPKELSAAEARAAEIQKAADEAAAKSPVQVAPELPVAERSRRGAGPGK